MPQLPHSFDRFNLVCLFGIFFLQLFFSFTHIDSFCKCKKKYPRTPVTALLDLKWEL